MEILKVIKKNTENTVCFTAFIHSQIHNILLLIEEDMIYFMRTVTKTHLTKISIMTD